MKNESLRVYLKNVHKLVYPLPRSKELKLARRIASGDKDAVGQLAEAYLKLSAEIAEAYYDKEGWRGITMLEFLREANTALVLAASKYSSTENSKHAFTDFARRYVKLYLDRLIDKDRFKPPDMERKSIY